LSQQVASRVQEAIAILQKLEKELDEVEKWVAEAKRTLLSLATVEGEKAMTEALSEANALVQERLEKARVNAEKEAAEIVQKSKTELVDLKARIDKSLEKAVDLVMKVILGEKKL
jgi:vacuolar-type H+-ATPase subunit H